MKMIDLKSKVTKRKAHIHEVDGDCCIELDMSTTLKFTNSEIKFDNPLIAASGSIGHSNEIFKVIDPREFGAITIKSLAPFVSPGNSSPRVGACETGMMNSVGLPGPHVQDWVEKELSKIDNSTNTSTKEVTEEPRINSEESETISNEFICPVCKRIFKNKSGLTNHMKVH